MSEQCNVDACAKPASARQMCMTHYHRSWRQGRPTTPLPRPTSAERFWKKVEKTETCWNWTAHVSPLGYGQVAVERRITPAHRVAWEMVSGPIPAGAEVDHACRNRKCVNPDHLRLATRKQNMENQSAVSRQSKSGVRGVFWCHRTEKWFARVKHNKRSYWAGYHDTIQEAAVAVQAKRNELYTHNDADRRAA